MKPFFITTPIYYANDEPHIGHAYTTVAADILARMERLRNREVIFSTGTDEHGAKIAEKAREAGQDPQLFVDAVAETFQGLWEKLNISLSENAFIRTTNKDHIKVVQKVLAELYQNGALYRGTYKGLYCVGCEQYKNEGDLVNGKCPDHDRVPEVMEEESYMLKMTELQSTLLEHVRSKKFHIYPSQYEKEVTSFLENQTLEDISLSRKNVTWGVPLPFDETHTTYVWADAFLNYLTVLGWSGEGKVPEAWPADIQLVGKDILRVHATIWPIMLLHLGVPLPKLLYTHGHILSAGKKMSKTLGNVISINEMLSAFGTDGTRYLLFTMGHFGDDIDITFGRLTEKYNADLANGLGNLVSRIMKLGESLPTLPIVTEAGGSRIWSEQQQPLQISKILEATMERVSSANRYMDETKPWILVKENKGKFEKVMDNLFSQLSQISLEIEPFMPDTAEKIKTALKTGKTEALFQRIQ